MIGGFFVVCRLSTSIAIYQQLLVYFPHLYQQLKVDTNKRGVAMKLNDTGVRKAKPESKAFKKADGGGLFLLVQPNGSKYWRLAYRFDGKQKLLALGVYPQISLADARQRRDNARKLLAQDIDPGENRKAAKAAKTERAENSFEVIAREWVASHMATKAASHRDRVLRRFEVYLFPWIGGKPIADLTAPEVLQCVKRIQQANKLETAHRVLQAAGQVCRYAVQHGRAVRDVTADLRGALP